MAMHPKAIGAAAVAVVLIGMALFVWGRPVSADATGKCGYYENSLGHQVPHPCGNWQSDPTPSRGATAQCRDGTWSWSEHPYAPGTCSHHGGVGRRL